MVYLNLTYINRQLVELTFIVFFKDHKNGCPYEDEECLACGGSIQRRLLEKHHDEECPKRIIECEHCQDEFTFVQKQASSSV